MVKNLPCDICGDNIICCVHTSNDIVGYCEDCCFCQEINCTQRVAYRTYQTHRSGSLTFTMIHDLCEKHINDFFPLENINKNAFVYRC